MSEPNDAFYNRVCDIRDGYPVRKRREQLAADIYTGVLTPTQKGCALLFERIGLLSSVQDVDGDILKALLAHPSVFAMLDDYVVSVQCAKAFVHLRMTQELQTLAYEAPGGLAFWRQFISRLESDVVFNLDVLEGCSLSFAPRRYLKRVTVYDPVAVTGTDFEIAAFIVKLCSGVTFVPRTDEKVSWWRVGHAEEALQTNDLLIAMAAYTHPSGRWPLAELPLSGETVSLFRANYLTKRAHFRILHTELKNEEAVLSNSRSSLIHLDSHLLAPRVHGQSATLRNTMLNSIEAVGFLYAHLEFDCTRVFDRVWADACDTIVAIQQSALGVCGQALPNYIVLDLLHLTQDGVTGLVTNQARLIALIEERTKRVCAVREEKERQRELLQKAVERANKYAVVHVKRTTTPTNKRKLDDMSAADKEPDYFS